MKNIFLRVCEILKENEEKAVTPEKQPSPENIEIDQIKLQAQKIKALAQLQRAKNEFKRAKVDQSAADKEEEDHVQKLTTTYPNQQPQVDPNQQAVLDPNQIPEDQQVSIPQEEIEPQIKNYDQDVNLTSGNPLNEPVAKEDVLLPPDDDIEKINEDDEVPEEDDEDPPLWNKYHPDPNDPDQMAEYEKSLQDPNQQPPLDPSQDSSQPLTQDPPNEPQGQAPLNEPPHEVNPINSNQSEQQLDPNQQLPISDPNQIPEDQQVPPQEELPIPQTKTEADIAKKQAEIKKIEMQTQALQNQAQMGSEDPGMAGMGGPMDSSMMGMPPQKPDPLKGFGDKTSGSSGMMGMGGMGGIDPMTGMMTGDNTAPINSSSIGRIYELKKSYYRLMLLDKMLKNCPDKEMNELQKVTSESFDLLRLIIQNLKTYKEKIDDIIVSYFMLIKNISSRLEQHYMKKNQAEED